MKWNKIALAAMVSAFLAGFVPAVWADDSGAGDYIKQRTYVGGFGSSTNIDDGGNFNGEWSVNFNNGEELDLIPSLDRNFGFGGMIGHRQGAYAAEVSYWRTSHNATWTGGGPTLFYGKASYHSLNVDFKRYFLTQLPTQPFFSLGLSLPWVIVEDASAFTSTSGTLMADTAIAGIGFNLGVGMEIYLGPDYSIVGGAIQRWAGYNQVNGAMKRTLDTTLNGQNINVAGDGLNFYVGATMGFE
jgi:hypothetical protein